MLITDVAVTLCLLANPQSCTISHVAILHKITTQSECEAVADIMAHTWSAYKRNNKPAECSVVISTTDQDRGT